MRTIGFFGDSFCGTLEADTKKFGVLTTYLRTIADRHNLEVVHQGVLGSSIYDCLLLQFENLIKINQVPDICVFVWTDFHRLFHRKTRGINFRSTEMNKHLGNEWAAAHIFYKELYDGSLFEFHYKSALYYYDNVVFPAMTDKTQIIHLWSFGYPKDPISPKDPVNPDNITYLHRWKTGVEIRPALITVTESVDDESPNHLDTQEKNDKVSDWISTAITNYENGKLLEF